MISNDFHNVLKFGYTTKSISIVLVDNGRAEKLVEIPKFQKRSKYIDIIYYYTRDIIQHNIQKIVLMLSENNTASIVTKNTGSNVFELLCTKII